MCPWFIAIGSAAFHLPMKWVHQYLIFKWGWRYDNINWSLVSDWFFDFKMAGIGGWRHEPRLPDQGRGSDWPMASGGLVDPAWGLFFIIIFFFCGCFRLFGRFRRSLHFNFRGIVRPFEQVVGRGQSVRGQRLIILWMVAIKSSPVQSDRANWWVFIQKKKINKIKEKKKGCGCGPCRKSGINGPA